MHFAYIEDEAEEEERQQKKTRKNAIRGQQSSARKMQIIQDVCKYLNTFMTIMRFAVVAAAIIVILQ